MNLNDLNEDQKAVYDNFLDLEQFDSKRIERKIIELFFSFSFFIKHNGLSLGKVGLFLGCG